MKRSNSQLPRYASYIDYQKARCFLAIGDMVHGKLTFHLLSLDLHQTQKSSCPLMATLIGLMGSWSGTKKKLVICNNAV